jgi:peptidoglycan/xylan/chitin deacetylase (PgdA/CDA1 family)
MDIGSHTRSHRILQTLAAEDLESELRGSREILEERTERPVRAIAYPVGYPVLDRPDILRALATSGYEIGFSAHTGVSMTIARPSRWDVRRLATDVEHTEDYFRATVVLPALARLREARTGT